MMGLTGIRADFFDDDNTNTTKTVYPEPRFGLGFSRF